MLARKNYTQQEIDQGKAALDQQLAAFKTLVRAVASATNKVDSVLESFEAHFFNNITLVLDRDLVHRLSGSITRARTGIR